MANDNRPNWLLSSWCVTAAFGAYFCMYAFRVPFAAGDYASTFEGLQLKTLLIASQVLGYTVSKFIGIKVIAEMTPNKRIAWLLGLVGFAEAALLGFALTPMPINCFFLFLNGLPLGMVFGLVLGFLEGRRHTEALTAALCSSFIIADGVTKSVGKFLLQQGVTEAWMPFVAGALFVPPLVFFAWMLSRIPAPSPDDVAARSERAPMTGADRFEFFRRYALGLSMLVGVYLLTTILRKVRGDFALEIWKGLGIKDDASVFTYSEIVVGITVPLLSGLAICVHDNRRAFFGGIALAMIGCALSAAALLGLGADVLSPLAFMVLHGLGLYLPYVLIHTTLFERLIAMTRDRGNIGYLMYLADAVGYLGYAAVAVGKNFMPTHANYLDFFVPLSWIIAIACAMLLIPCWWYFAVHPATRTSAALEPART